MCRYEAEQARREALLAEEKRELELTAALTRQRLNDAEVTSRALGTHAALLDRRRFLERQNAAEEGQARSLMGAMAVERARDAQLVGELVAKEAEMKVCALPTGGSVTLLSWLSPAAPVQSPVTRVLKTQAVF